MIRADLQRRIGQMRARIDQNARYQEGEEPTEDASSLIEEVSDALNELEELVLAVNLTNASLLLPDGRTMTAALAKRETLRARHSLLTSAADAAQGRDGYRQMRSELRQLPAVPVAELRQRADTTARDLRNLDVNIQRTNWEADLLI